MFFFFFTFIFSHNNLIQRPKTNLIQFPTHLSPLSLSLSLSLTSSSSSLSSTHTRPDPFLYPTHQTHRIIYDQDKTTPPPPSIAYLISGSKGDSSRILRLLSATYHPLNHYLLHLDPSAPHSDRANLALVVQSNPIFKAAQNVYVMRKPDIVILAFILIQWSISIPLISHINTPLI
ncbi:beta-glucuronosyltransferase GlcAT14A [Trifolium repens]|nr:beta-glucuronosyltransferase GlcAT14A [Trifolium repens]